MALFWRVWTAVTVVTLGVLAVFVALATIQFGTIQTALVRERLAVLAERTAAPFAAANRLGLPMSAVRNAPALLERAQQTDDSIVAIHVFAADGAIVHSTAVPAPAAISEVTAAAGASAGGALWFREAPTAFLSSIDIGARDGTRAGGILIVYPRTVSSAAISAMAAELSIAALAILGVAAVLGAIILRWGLARQIRRFTTIDEAVAQYERNSWRGAAGRSKRDSDPDEVELRHLLEAAEFRYQALGLQISSARERDA